MPAPTGKLRQVRNRQLSEDELSGLQGIVSREGSDAGRRVPDRQRREGLRHARRERVAFLTAPFFKGAFLTGAFLTGALTAPSSRRPSLPGTSFTAGFATAARAGAVPRTAGRFTAAGVAWRRPPWR